ERRRRGRAVHGAGGRRARRAVAAARPHALARRPRGGARDPAGVRAGGVHGHGRRAAPAVRARPPRAAADEREPLRDQVVAGRGGL
ncbi:MAG: hypothetical protein AVDCRST_MAG11-1564, partial [uncultured Gemmatimonadaceae bacterium]